MTDTCTAIGGCIGNGVCDYCGDPLPVPHTARNLLTALIEQLRHQTPAPTGPVGTRTTTTRSTGASR